MKPFVYLASQSPRRAQLLEQLGVAFELLLPEAHEDAEGLEVVMPHELPVQYVQRVTELKLDAALKRLKAKKWPLAPVLCCDTTVALRREILGKPSDDLHAVRMLQSLSGQTHKVLTAVAVGTVRKRAQVLSQSRVTFTEMSLRQIKAYVATGEPMGKAGAYAAQGRAAMYIQSIHGSYTGIIGLPLFETAQLLQTFGCKL
jgi:septum formation protein